MKIDVICLRATLLIACVGVCLSSAALADEDALGEPIAKAMPIERRGMPEADLLKVDRQLQSGATPLVATVQLNVSDDALRGQLLSSPQISVTTSFGEVDVPLSEVAGIKLASQGTPTTTIVLHNGDSITGACDIGRVELRTEWGLADVEGTAINTLLFIDGVTWVSDDTLGGARWRLVDKRAGKEGTPQKLEAGDKIKVINDANLTYGDRSSGKVREGEILTVQQVQGQFVFVRADNNRHGWLPMASAQRTN